MNDRDDKRPSLDDSAFDDFLADLEENRVTVPPPSASAPTPAKSPAAPFPPPAKSPAAPARVDFGVDVDLGFDDDEDGATRVGEIPAELLAALGRKPASEAATVPPPPPDPDDFEVSLDDISSPSLAITVPPPAEDAPPSGELGGEANDRPTWKGDETDDGAGVPDEDRVVLETGDDEDEVVIETGDDEDEVLIEAGDQEDEVVIEAGDDEDEVVIETGDEEPIAAATRNVRTAAVTKPPTEAAPLLTLVGSEQLLARAHTLEEWAADAARPELAIIAAADLAERAHADSTASYFARAATPEARRAEVRRGARKLHELPHEDLGGDVAASFLVRDAVRAARSGDEAEVSRLLEAATTKTRNPHFSRFIALALARSAERRGDARRATAVRLAAMGADATTGTSVSIARAQLAQGDRKDAAATLRRASARETDPALAAAVGRWLESLEGAALGQPKPSSPRLADLADAVAGTAGSTRVSSLSRLAASVSDDAKSVLLAQLGSAQARAGSLEDAAASFDASRRLSARSALVDAIRDAEARRAANPSRLAPTRAQDDDDGGVLASLGRALGHSVASEETLAALNAARANPQAARAVHRMLADVAANLGDPNTWLEASTAESAEGEGRSGLAVTRALILARAGDRDAASAQLGPSSDELSAAARALLLASTDRDAAAAALADGIEPSLHVRVLASRLARDPAIPTLVDLLRDAKTELPLALRLEQRAKNDGNGLATATALEALAEGALTEVDRRKFRLLAASGGSATNALELAPDDPVLLAEALLQPRVPTGTRDRALEVLTAGASHITTAVLHARASTLAQVDGSPADSALQLRTAHDAVPNEPSLGVSVEFAELAADQPARLAHRFFGKARAESADSPTRARAFVRLAELDRRERSDATAALASFHAALELAPDHVPTLRALESIVCDRSEPDLLEPVEIRLAAALAPGLAADAHARLAVRQRFARGGHPASDLAPVVLHALERRTKSSRLLRWAEHSTRDGQDGREITVLEQLLENTTMPAERAELALRMALYAIRREDRARAIASVETALQADPSHSVAIIERAILLDTEPSHAIAAGAHESAADVAMSTSNAVRHLLRAAEHREADGDPAAARAAITTALRRSPTDPTILAALVALHERGHDLPAAIAAVEERIALGGSPDELATCNRRLAELGEASGALEVARAAYRRILAITPDDVQVLRRVAELSLAANDGAPAADALLRLARILKTPEELAWVFLGLGDCYERLVPDARRAEGSHARVLQVDPGNRLANERMVALLVGQKRLDEALGRVEAYEHIEHDATLARRLRLSIARGHERAGDFRSAEKLLEDLRRSRPTDVEIQLELARFFEARGGGPPLSMHLTRALGDLRRAFEEHPSPEALRAILEILRHRGRPDALACAEAAAAVLGVDRDPQGRAFTHRVAGAGARANVREIDDLLAPRSLPEGTRAALVLASSAIEHAFPFDAKAFQAERLPKDSPIRAQALVAAEAFGFGDVVVLVTSAAPRLCIPVAASPLTLVIGRELPQITTDAEREFLFARAAKIAVSGMAFALRMQPAQVGLTVHALIRAHLPSHMPEGVDPAALEHAAKAIAKHLPKDQHERGPLCIEMGTRPNFEPQRIGLAAAELADRVALVSTGQVHAAIRSVIRLAGRDVDAESGFDAKLALVRSMPEAWGLLLFALSDAHSEARQRVGMPA